VTLLLDRLDDQADRDWYARAAVDHGWSRNVLVNQIMNWLHERTAAAPSNFAGRLPTNDSELAQQLRKDPYLFVFLGLTGAVVEPAFSTRTADGEWARCVSALVHAQ
jgi:predicted nuclease of restriction endonuclease-like (RecB) superfamily